MFVNIILFLSYNKMCTNLKFKLLYARMQTMNKHILGNEWGLSMYKLSDYQSINTKTINTK